MLHSHINIRDTNKQEQSFQSQNCKSMVNSFKDKAYTQINCSEHMTKTCLIKSTNIFLSAQVQLVRKVKTFYHMYNNQNGYENLAIQLRFIEKTNISLYNKTELNYYLQKYGNGSL